MWHEDIMIRKRGDYLDSTTEAGHGAMVLQRLARLSAQPVAACLNPTLDEDFI